ncbi:hypothetical protein GOP47_0006328 [Adiantum capillus-veneris]|uniref:Uncharacterized protein n=1 Tax=Adiantum capillus-veneris TaxID=13818 RepID=A0A9D4V469_ADICA|nr:hypothetical protein GOP47_0006328 [Adiantum capillus-veneris]
MSNVVQGTTGEAQQQTLHILVVPYQSEGHINGMLRLVQALAAEKGVLVTFGYPARFHSSTLKRNKHCSLLNTSFSGQSNSMLRVEVVEDGLPLEEEQPLTDEQKRASVPIFQNADLADDAGLPRVDFWSSTAAVYSTGTQLALLVSKGILPLPKSCWLVEEKWSVEAALIEGIPGLPPFPPTDLPRVFVQAEEVSDSKLQFGLAGFRRAREAHAILVHSVYELESQVFDALQATGFPSHAVGPLPNSALEPSTTNHECIQWLGTQPPSSVIYVALGSIAIFTSAEMHALALALESSGHPFLWVIRPDSISATLSEVLPEGFLQRTVAKHMGLIISWSPQAENWKIGVELERQHDGSFTKEAVERALKDVFALEGKEGPTYKETALHFKKVARSAMQNGGTSHSNLVNFLQHLRHSPHCDNRFSSSN